MPERAHAPPIEIDLAHESRTLDTDRLTRALLAALAGESASLAHLSVVLADHETVLALNRDYLDHDYHTDVLAFDLGEGDQVDGEIYVDLDTAAERCAEFGEDYEREAVRYAVHGLLHLIGYRDKTPEAKATMHKLEERYLAA
jgi:rRNA maturation RNase YbeY